jgi:hypothetical protein
VICTQTSEKIFVLFGLLAKAFGVFFCFNLLRAQKRAADNKARTPLNRNFTLFLEGLPGGARFPQRNAVLQRGMTDGTRATRLR